MMKRYSISRKLQDRGLTIIELKVELIDYLSILVSIRRLNIKMKTVIQKKILEIKRNYRQREIYLTNFT